MTLLENEQVMFRTKRDDFLVTTHRVRDGAGDRFTSIMLEDVCSVRVVRLSFRWLLYASIAAFLFAAYSGLRFVNALDSGQERVLDQAQTAGGVGLVVGLVLLIAFFITRYSAVEIASAGAVIDVTMSRVNDAAELVAALESAKNDRYMLLTKGVGGTAGA